MADMILYENNCDGNSRASGTAAPVRAALTDAGLEFPCLSRLSPRQTQRWIPAMIGWTLGRYLSARFLRTIVVVFLTISGMIYVVDFVELLRRAGNIQGVSAGEIAYLSFLRVPSVSEQIMPFCVLFGTMAAFVNLTRKLELLVARAVGVSVWGFLVPPLAIAAAAGIGSVVLFNPVSAVMKHRADMIETRLFGRNGKQNDDTSLWIRQKSVDGEAFIRASQASADGAYLTSAAAYVYDRAGTFEQRIEAQTGKLLPGVWQFGHARVTAPGEESFAAGTLSSRHKPFAGGGRPRPDRARFRAVLGVAVLARRGRDRWPRRNPLPAPISDASGETAPVYCHGLNRGGIFLKVFSFWWNRENGYRWRGRRVRALCGGQNSSAILGGAGLLSPLVAAWSPAVVASLLGAFALLNQEDG